MKFKKQNRGPYRSGKRKENKRREQTMKDS